MIYLKDSNLLVCQFIKLEKLFEDPVFSGKSLVRIPMHRSLRKRRLHVGGAKPLMGGRNESGWDENPARSAGFAQSILYVTSEMADFVKVGGLGDVSSALPRALRDYHDVRVLIPGYREVLARHDEISIVARLPAASGLPACDLGQIEMPDGLSVYIVLCSELYDRDGSPYGDSSGVDWIENDVRFARLALAAAEIASGFADLDWRPDLLHLNDWPSALALTGRRSRGQQSCSHN